MATTSHLPLAQGLAAVEPSQILAQRAPQSKAHTSTIPFPHAPDKSIYISVTMLETSYLIFLTSGASTNIQSTEPIASLVDTQLLRTQASSSLADASLLEAGFQTPLPTVGAGAGMGTSALGSFIYGIPNRFSPSEPLTTPLVSVPSTLDLATRICRILVRKLSGLFMPKPLCLGCSIVFDGYGDAVEEEISVVRGVVEEVVKIVQMLQSEKLVNGIKEG